MHTRPKPSEANYTHDKAPRRKSSAASETTFFLWICSRRQVAAAATFNTFCRAISLRGPQIVGGFETVITQSGIPVFSKPASNRGLPHRPSAPALGRVGSHLLTSGRASCAYLSCTPRHGDRRHRGQHPPLPNL